ncbi:hypothetical protein [Phenylobacterium soli]|nr:hypothetical protein [Phenylobacterium soli]
MSTDSGPCWLDERQAHQLLDIYEVNGARRAFNDLYAAAEAAFSDFIPRACIFRKEVA